MTACPNDDPLALIRAEVMAQPVAERADYALDLLAYYLDPVPAFFAGCHALGLGLPLADLRMIYALARRHRSFVSVEGLLAARCLDRPCEEWATPDLVAKRISAVRRRFEALRLPVEIVNFRGIGYRMILRDGFTFEGAAP